MGQVTPDLGDALPFERSTVFHEGRNEEAEGGCALKEIGGGMPRKRNGQAWKGRLEMEPSLSWEQGRAGIQGTF